MIKTVYGGDVEYLQLCDPEGNLDAGDLTVDLSEPRLDAIHRWMALSRALDERAVQLQRQGRLGTYASSRGQEGCQVGCALALEDSDWIFPSYREMPMQLVLGVPPEDILTYWGGDERGSHPEGDVPVFPVSIPVGSQALHAVGAARARQDLGDPMLAVACFGDGATSEGDLLEALNFAGVWEVPVLFFCQNNQWAISTARDRQTASETLAQKALGFGLEGKQVDGNDPIAVYQVVRELRERALEESRPFFLEALTYRMGAHTTSDDPERYRPESEVARWEERDPLRRLTRLRRSRGEWDEDRQDQLEGDVEETVEQAVDAYESRPDPEAEEMFRHTYETLTDPLREQLEDFRSAEDDDD